MFYLMRPFRTGTISIYKDISKISLDFDSNLDGSMMRVVVFGAPLIIDIIESI